MIDGRGFDRLRRNLASLSTIPPKLFCKIIYSLFVVVGCTLKLGSVLVLSDALIFIVAVPNVIGLYLLAPEAKKQLDDYLSRTRTEV